MRGRWNSFGAADYSSGMFHPAVPTTLVIQVMDLAWVAQHPNRLPVG